MNHLLQQNHWSSKMLPRAEPGSKDNKALMAAAVPLSGEKATLMGSRHAAAFWQGFLVFPYCPPIPDTPFPPKKTPKHPR